MAKKEIDVATLRHVGDKRRNIPTAELESVMRPEEKSPLRIAYERLDQPSRVAHQIAEAQTLAYASNKPVALLLCRDLMWES